MKIVVLVALFSLLHLAGCLTVQSLTQTVEKLKGANAQLIWSITRSSSVTSYVVSFAYLDKDGSLDSDVVAQYNTAGGHSISQKYAARGWTAALTNTRFVISAKNIQPEDDGTYAFRLTVNNGDSKKSKVILQVLVKPYFPTKDSYTDGLRTVDEGDPIKLRCEPEGSPKPIKIDWKKDGVSLGLKKDSLNNPNLVFDSVNQTHDGVYTCLATNRAGGAEKTPKVTLDVKFKPVNTRLFNTSVLVDGVRGFLECTCEADPSATFTFNGPVDYKDRRSGRIDLLVQYRNHNGKTLACTPSNRIGDGPSALIKIDVKVKPEVLIKGFTQKMTAIHGRNYSMVCYATGKPSAEIIWLKNSSPIRDNPKTNIIGTVSGTDLIETESKLILHPANRYTDNGGYTCLAKNAYGDDTRSATLQLLYLPEITTDFRNREVVINARAELPCDGTGEPKVSYYIWRWDNGTVIQNRTTGMLTFEAIKQHQGGRLSCAAGSYMGEGPKKYLYLFVRVPPRIDMRPEPRISLNITQRLLLFCNATGVPEPTITWSLNGRILENKGEYLDIPSVKSSDRGIYNCSASNGILPNATAISRVTIYFAPEIITNTPVNTMKGAESGANVQLICTVEANPPAILEWLYYPSRNIVNKTDTAVKSIEKTSEKTTQLTLIAEIGAKYLCHAYNNRGNSSQLYEIRSIGEPESPTLEVVRTYISNEPGQLSSVHAYLKWIPGYDGGMSVWYTIAYRKTDESFVEINNVQPSCNCYTIKKGLEAGVDYSFYLQAHNTFGPSTNSEVKKLKTTAFYGKASVDRFSEGKIVKVTLIKFTEENITKVIIRYRALQDSLWIEEDMTYEMRNDQPYIIERLDPLKVYEFHVLWYVGDSLQITFAGQVGDPNPPTGGRSGNTLSKEEIIAIIAGVGGFLLIVILILFLCLIRRRRKPKRDEEVVVMRRQPGSAAAEITRRSLIGSVEDDPFESAHYGGKEKQNGKARDSYYLPNSEDMNTFNTDDTARHSMNPAENDDAYQPYRFGKKPKYENHKNSVSSEEDDNESISKPYDHSDEESEPRYSSVTNGDGKGRYSPDGRKDRYPRDEKNNGYSPDNTPRYSEPEPDHVYSSVNKGNKKKTTPYNNNRGAPPPYRPRSTADTPRRFPSYPDEPLDLDDPSSVGYNEPLPPPMPVLPASRSVPDNMYENNYPNYPEDDDSTLEREKSPSRTSLPGKPYINVHGKLVRPSSSGRLSSSENVEERDKTMPEPEVPSGRTLDNDERNLVSYLV